MGIYLSIAAARERSESVDDLVTRLAASLHGAVAVVALDAYGRKELTPRSDVDLLLLHTGQLSNSEVTQALSYPLWEKAVHLEPLLRTPEESIAHGRRSWAAATHLLDARLIAGDEMLFNKLRHEVQQLRRDRDRLRSRLRADAEHRHASHSAVTSSGTPDLLAGRGGLLDFNALRWLEVSLDDRMLEAFDYLLGAVSRAEQLTGHAAHRLSKRIVERLEGDGTLLSTLYAHARKIAFNLDNVLAPDRDDRQLGPGLAMRDGVLVAERPPPLARAPAYGLRIANLVGLAPPSLELLEWANQPGPPLPWDESTQEQFWLVLRAADWRAWDFLDVTGLIQRLLPEMEDIHCKPGGPRTADMAPDTHSFLALRRLHEWSESEDPFARRAWRWLRHRDWVYLAVLLHELPAEDAVAAVRRLGLDEGAVETVRTAVDTFQLIDDTATRRDLHDEDLVLELATRIGSRQRLSTAFLTAVAHDIANGAAAWSLWKTDLMRQLFGHLEIALRQPAEVGARRTRTLEQQRERVVRQLQRLNLYQLAPLVGRLPRRYLMTHTPAFAARHLAMLARGPLGDGEVRVEASRRRPGLWDLLIVARDRPGLLAMVAGVLALRGASVLAADAATSSDGLVLDVFTVSASTSLEWSQVDADVQQTLLGRIPLRDLLGARLMEPEEAAATQVVIDNKASQFFNVVEVRAPDQVGLLYRIASALHAERLDIHHARIATYPEGALDVFYVRDLSGKKLSDEATAVIATRLTSRLRGELE